MSRGVTVVSEAALCPATEPSHPDPTVQAGAGGRTGTARGACGTGDGPASALRAAGASAWASPRWAWVLLPKLVGVVVAVLALVYGWNLRMGWFEASGDVRFRWDIQNAMNQANATLHSGGLKRTPGERPPLMETLRAWVARYDKVYEQAGGSGRYSLDYTPLRLLVMTLWMRELWAGEGGVRNYDDAMAWPLMRLNAVCGLLTAAGVFLLVRHWLRRAAVADAPPSGRIGAAWAEHRPWVLGWMSALLVWLNLTLLLNAHVFPQWDVWLLPFFVFGVYAASLGGNGWVVCGGLLAVGAMLKGQVLLAAPVLVVWAAASDARGVNLLRLAAGLGAGAAMVTWPWLVQTTSAAVWGGAMAGTALLLAGASWGLSRWHAFRETATRVSDGGRTRWLLGLGGATVAAAVTSFPLWSVAWPWAASAAAVGAVAGWAVARWPRRALPGALAGAVALAVFAGAWRYGGSWSWYDVGFRFPTDNYQALAMGTTANLPAILQDHYGWKLKDEVTVLGAPIRWQTLLRWVYAVMVLPVGLMAAWYARRHDPRVLLCVAAPWVLMFAVLPQMHERYLVWGAVLTALGVAAVSGAMARLGMLGLHLLTTAAGAACVGVLILRQGKDWWPEMERALNPAIPAVGWGVVLLGLIYWFLCLLGPRPATGRAAGESSEGHGGARRAF